MADKSAIEWTDATWSPTVGCSIVSPGCTNCYAMRLAGRLEKMGSAKYAGLTQPSKAGAVWNGIVRLDETALALPLRWRWPRRIFVNSMSDLFHENLPDAAIDQVFAVMALAPQHIFQVLTKRAERMREYLATRNGMGNAAICRAINKIPSGLGNRHGALEMPLPNVWFGVSVEDQARADERIPHLLATPAAVRFLSCEPLLGPVDLHLSRGLTRPTWPAPGERGGFGYVSAARSELLHWVIAGGESGPRARPMSPAWARSLRDDCARAGVAFFHKQNGEYREHSQFEQRDSDAVVDGVHVVRVGKKAAGRSLDGVEHNAFPVPR